MKYAIVDMNGEVTCTNDITDDDIKMVSDGEQTILRWAQDHFEFAECEVTDEDGENEDFVLDWTRVDPR